MEQIGPITIEIPASTPRSVKSCSGCIYHKHTLIKSGANPVYNDNCTHNIAPKDNRVTRFEFTGNLRKENDIVIPSYWCPYLNKINKDSDTYEDYAQGMHEKDLL